MADSQQSPAPLTDSLRSDVLLLSTQLSGKQSTSSESHPTDTELRFLLTSPPFLLLVHSHSPDAKNVNAVLGKITLTGTELAMEFLVCAENAKQDDTQVRALKGQLKNKPPQGRKEKDMDTPSAPIAGKNKEQSAKSAEDIVHLDDYNPNGREWQEATQISGMISRNQTKRSAWAQLQSHLLVKESDGKNTRVRTDSPSADLAKAELAQYHNRVQSPNRTKYPIICLTGATDFFTLPKTRKKQLRIFYKVGKLSWHGKPPPGYSQKGNIFRTTS
ncbi:hypothetical protein BT96DRAFT_947297 [Gymnopus androsaceus JB14]|uniref:Uncharacterized protein n=1 Tax=Gymnopus androsaceus JB14 TaxID=1447944 RepID=A0A6A4GUS8_9AGAR|nr:hypothetical protein BT96DRAFT_947297 [Gymnopus androsaceus JB14]